MLWPTTIGCSIGDGFTNQARDVFGIVMRLVGGRLNPFAVAMATLIERKQPQVFRQLGGDPLPPPCVGGIAMQQNDECERRRDSIRGNAGAGSLCDESASRHAHQEAFDVAQEFFEDRDQGRQGCRTSHDDTNSGSTASLPCGIFATIFFAVLEVGNGLFSTFT